MGCALPFGSGAPQGLLLIGSVLVSRFLASSPGLELVLRGVSTNIIPGCSQSPGAQSKGPGMSHCQQ